MVLLLGTLPLASFVSTSLSSRRLRKKLNLQMITLKLSSWSFSGLKTSHSIRLPRAKPEPCVADYPNLKRAPRGFKPKLPT